MTSTATDDAYVSMTVDVNMTSFNESVGEAESVMDFYAKNAPVGVAVDRIMTPIFYFIGIPCNPLCAVIWLGRETRKSNSSAIYLGALSISHTVFLILHIFIELHYAWGIKTFDGHVTCEVYYTIYILPQYLAPLLVLGFTVERYIAVCHPFVKERYCTVRRAVVVVLALLGFCFLLSCPQAYLWTYDENYMMCNHRESLHNSDFPRLWTWVTELFVFGIAPLAALVFNVLVIREIRSITTRGPAIMAPRGSGGGQNQASTMTLLAISFYLICTWLPATIVYSLEREFPMGEGKRGTDPAWDRHWTYFTVRKVVEEVTLSNSACYFFIYYVTGKHFRIRFKRLMCPQRCLNSGSDSSSINGRSCTNKQYMAVRSNGYNDTCVTKV
ncbi:probable G-protein coupled receptor 139 [Littorina saxatilis]|uniref:probable G-protein coupled receptor 139 n=1 Tax=Littorina saxatilis TaxID=31220 RepID=UPI0038B6700F